MHLWLLIDSFKRSSPSSVCHLSDGSSYSQTQWNVYSCLVNHMWFALGRLWFLACIMIEPHYNLGRNINHQTLGTHWSVMCAWNCFLVVIYSWGYGTGHIYLSMSLAHEKQYNEHFIPRYEGTDPGFEKGTLCNLTLKEQNYLGFWPMNISLEATI